MTADLLESLVADGHTVDVYAEYINEPYERHGVNVKNSGYITHSVVSTYDVFITHPEIRTMVWYYVQGAIPYIAIVHNLNVNTIRSLERHTPHLTVANSYTTLGSLPESVRPTTVIHPPIGQARTDTVPRDYTTINLSRDKGGDVLYYVAKDNPSLPFAGVRGGHGIQIIGQPNNVRVKEHSGDMHVVYQNTRALLFPTRSETYGKVVVEAMQHGIPVIASDLPGVREAGGDAAVYLDPNDYPAWSQWVRNLQNDDVHAELSQKSIERHEVLHAQTRETLERWGKLVEEVAALKTPNRWSARLWNV